MPRKRRTQAEVYPKLLTFQQAQGYYDSIPPLRGHRDNPARQLAKGHRAFTAWRIMQTTQGIACMRSTHALIIYHRIGTIQITPSASHAQELAILRAIAPIDSAKWDYYHDCLVVHVDGERHTCKVGESIWLTPA